MKQKSLCSILVSELGLNLREPKAVAVASKIVLYLTGVETAYEFQHEVKNLVDFNVLEDSAKTFRLKLLETAYLSMKLKYFSYCLAMYKFDLQNLAAFARDFDIDRNDAVLIRRVFEQRGFRRYMRKSRRIAGLSKEDVNIDAFRSMSLTFDGIYPDLLRYIRRLSWTKLRFLAFSTNTESSDFNGELMCKAIKTFNHLMPSKHESLYVKNYIKRTLSNHTTNIIKEYTTQKRGRLVKGKKDGFGSNEFQLTVVSENQLFQTFGADAAEYDTLRDSVSNNDEIKLRDSELNMESILRSFGTTSKRRDILRLISGVDHSEFTVYLQENGLIDEASDNVDYYHRVSHSTYLKRICTYLDVRYSSACAFLDYVGRKAYPEKTVYEDRHVSAA